MGDDWPSILGVAGQELPGAFLLGMVDDLVGVALLHDHASIHEDHLIRHITGKGHFVGDDDHGSLLLRQIANDPQYLAGQPPVQVMDIEEFDAKNANTEVDEDFYGDSEYDPDELDEGFGGINDNYIDNPYDDRY